MQTRTPFILAVYLFLKKDNKAFLTKRKNTGYEDGNFSCIAGHVEKKETLIETMIREAREEAGIKIREDDLKLFHVMSRMSEAPRFDFFYFAKNWEGKPIINEPDLCSEIGWFDLENLPKNTIPYIQFVLKTINDRKITYSSYDWK